MKNQNEITEIELENDSEVVKSEPVNVQGALIELAGRKDIDTTKLKELIELQERMEAKQAEKELNNAMANFQSDCPNIVQTKRGHTNEYAPLEEIVRVIKPILSKYGLSYTFNTKRVDNSYSELETTIKHRSGASFSSYYEFVSLDSGGKMNDSQRKKSALTYARRAGLEAALGIATVNADDDAKTAIDKPITGDQIETIKDLMKSTDTTQEQFFKYMRIEKLENISELDGKKAITALKAKRSALISKDKV